MLFRCDIVVKWVFNNVVMCDSLFVGDLFVLDLFVDFVCGCRVTLLWVLFYRGCLVLG